MTRDPYIRASRRRRLPSRGRSLLYSALTFALTLLVIEIGSHLFVPPTDVTIKREHDELIRVLGLPDMVGLFERDPDLFWRLRPNLDRMPIEGTVGPYPVSFAVSTNDLGFRSGPIPARKGEFRVLALGNSCTFGVGVDDHETWPARLEEILEARLGGDVLVINGSVPGYSAWQGRRFLEIRGLDLAPDLVIACFGFNDAATWSSRSDPETARLLVAGRVGQALRRSRAYTGLSRVLAPSPENPEPPGGEEGKPRLSTREFYENLADIHELCEEQEIPVLFLLWPFRKQVEERNAEPLAYQSLVHAAAEAERVPVIDLVDPFIRAGGSLYADNIHGNARGCAVAADAIADALERARVR